MIPAVYVRAAAWAALLGLVVYIVAPARAQPVLFDCEPFATGIARMADFRDTGADLGRVIAMARKRNPDMPFAYRAVVEREMRRLWREGLPAERAREALYRRCMEQLGDMGRES